MSEKITELRGSKLKQSDLGKFYSAKEALDAGLIDSIGRVYSTMPKFAPNSDFTVLKQSKYEEIKAAIRNALANQAK